MFGSIEWTELCETHKTQQEEASKNNPNPALIEIFRHFASEGKKSALIKQNVNLPARMLGCNYSTYV